jgi:hypothetical protein
MYNIISIYIYKIDIIVLHIIEIKDRMSLQQIIKALDILVEYPDIIEYIKNFKGYGGFMYTIETDPILCNIHKKMEELLDSRGMHSGGSWSYMLRMIQLVLNGSITRESIMQEIAEEDRKYREWKEQYEVIKNRINSE